MARTKTDIETELANVRQAMDQIVQGKAAQVEISGRTVQYLDLEQLRRRERELVAELNAARGAKRHSVATFANG